MKPPEMPKLRSQFFSSERVPYVFCDGCQKEVRLKDCNEVKIEKLMPGAENIATAKHGACGGSVYSLVVYDHDMG